MGTELIRSVTVQKNNVYLTSKSNNDDQPYRFWHCESLSEVYRKEGLPGLDREVIRMLCEYAQLVGNHKSIARYRSALRSKKATQIHQQFIAKLNAAYSLLSDEDKAHLYFAQTAAAKRFRQTERLFLDQTYTAMAQLCSKDTGELIQAPISTGRGDLA